MGAWTCVAFSWKMWCDVRLPLWALDSGCRSHSRLADGSGMVLIVGTCPLPGQSFY